jgi:hypothetical protein
MESWAENSRRIREMMASHPVPETTEVHHEAIAAFRPPSAGRANWSRASRPAARSRQNPKARQGAVHRDAPPRK